MRKRKLGAPFRFHLLSLPPTGGDGHVQRAGLEGRVDTGSETGFEGIPLGREAGKTRREIAEQVSVQVLVAPPEHRRVIPVGGRGAKVGQA